MSQSFPFKSVIATMVMGAAALVAAVSSVLYYRVYPHIEALTQKMELEQARRLVELDLYRSNGFLPVTLEREYYHLQPKDEDRFFDCKWKAHDVFPQPFVAYPYLNFFNPKSKDSFTGLASINEWPSLIYASNLKRYNHGRSRVLLGIRGSDYGIHKSNLPMELVALQKRNQRFEDDLILMPDNYVFIHKGREDITRDPIQAACHNRTYDGNRYVSNYWQSFDNGAFWDRYDQILTNDLGVTNDNVFIFAYSNGSSPRHQLMKTVQDGPCAGDSLEEYSACHKFVDKRAMRIKSIVDIETNYDTNNLMPTAMFVNENIRGKEGRYYYAACASEDCPISNHYRLAMLLELQPHTVEPGFVRYEDETKRIVVDIIDYRGPLRYSHSTIIPFAIKQFESISLH